METETSQQGTEDTTDSDFNVLLSALKQDEVITVEREADRLGIDRLKQYSDKHYGETLVHVAALHGSNACLAFLESKGLDLHELNDHCENAVHSAVRSRSLKTVRLLNEKGVSLDIQNKKGECPIHLAALTNDIPLMEFLCTAVVNISVRDKSSNTALHLACAAGLHKIVMVLCAANAPVDLQNKHGLTPLMCACLSGSMDCVKLLLSAKAKINLEDKKGFTALEHAIHRHQTTVALILINGGAKVNHVDQNRDTCLHVACREGLLPVVQALCAYGCSVDIFNGAGVTPLQMAARAGDMEIVRCLLLAGANPQLANKKGIYPDVMALAQNHAAVASLISRMKPERRAICVEQLVPTTRTLPRIKMKVFGHTKCGKTTLISSLQNSYITGFFKRKFKSMDFPSESDGIGFTLKERNLPSEISYEIKHEAYTRGIFIQNVKMNGIGDLSVWEFSGYEPYFITYDHFIGDANCLHMVLFSLQDPVDVMRSKVAFWLHFLKARLPAREPLGYCGKPRILPKVLLVGTHADVALNKAGNINNNNGSSGQRAARNSNSVWYCPEAVEILREMRDTFMYTLDIVEEIAFVDCNDPLSPEMKELKNTLSTAREEVLKRLPNANGFLDVVSARISDWTEHSQFPVVTWEQFVEQVRSRVNQLASEDHLKDLVQQLQYTGEIVYVESEAVQDLIILRPQWLCHEVIGSLFSHENIRSARITGSFTIDDIHFMVASRDTRELLYLLAALDLCAACPVEDEIQYEFPALVFVENEPDPSWNSLVAGMADDEALTSDKMCCGWQIHAPRSQLIHIFPRFMCRLRKSLTYDPEVALDLAGVENSTSPTSDDDEEHNGSGGNNRQDSVGSSSQLRLDLKELHMIQWFHGARIFTVPEESERELLCQISMEEEGQVIEIKCLGRLDCLDVLFGLFQDVLHLLEQVIEEMCPCLEYEIFVIEPRDLRNSAINGGLIHVFEASGSSILSGSHAISSYSSHQPQQRNYTMIPQGVLFGEMLYLKSQPMDHDAIQSQRRLDKLLFFSKEHIRQRVTLGPELHISSLRSPTFQRLCFLLDPPDEMGRDWCLLAIKLDMQQHVPQFDNTNEWLRSRTAKILDEWGREVTSSIARLVEALKNINRMDAAQVIINHAPLFSLSSLADAATETTSGDLLNCPPATDADSVPLLATLSPSTTAGVKSQTRYMALSPGRKVRHLQQQHPLGVPSPTHHLDPFLQASEVIQSPQQVSTSSSANS